MPQYLQRWLVRGLIQLAAGGTILLLAEHFLPPASAGTAGFKFVGALLTASAGALVLVDLFFTAASRKFDEPLSASSVLKASQRHRWRQQSLAAEKELMMCFAVTLLLKVSVLAIGALLTMELFPSAMCLGVAQTGIFLMGMALPMLALMPAAYFAARRARIILAAYEEREAERLKVLEALSAAPAHDFQADPYYANFGRVITEGPRSTP